MNKRPPESQPKTQMAIGCFFIPFLIAVALFGAFFYVRANASAQLTVPPGEVLLVRGAPDESAPLLARFGEGRKIDIAGRTHDWRWLEVELWDGQRGWALRPLDILVWQINAPETVPGSSEASSAAITTVKTEMIALPATTFTMGSPPGIGEDDERPAHTVSLSAFEIDRTEVTIGQYWQCVQVGACAAPTNDASQSDPHYLNDPAFDNYPVINVLWTEANNYCIWRGKRLPTEAEWEMAAGWNIERNAKLQWPWGNDLSQGQGNVGDTSLGRAARVGTYSKDQSPMGVLDMAGNVSEWVFDWYKVDYYSVADDTDPIGPSPRRGEGSGRVVRGASFTDSVEQARTTNRSHQEPTYGYTTVGFRCARDIQ